jgi:hypothetical protein
MWMERVRLVPREGIEDELFVTDLYWYILLLHFSTAWSLALFGLFALFLAMAFDVPRHCVCVCWDCRFVVGFRSGKRADGRVFVHTFVRTYGKHMLLT